MEIRCHCAACGADFGIGKELAGENVRCVKCGAHIALPPFSKPRNLPVAAAIEPSPAPQPSLFEIIGLDSPATKVSHVALKSKPRPTTEKKRAKRWQGWQITAFVAGGSTAMLGIVLAIAWGLSAKPTPGTPKAIKNQAVLLVEIPEDQRHDAIISIDDGNGAQRKELPRSGPVEYMLAAGKCRVQIDRADYHAENSLVLKPGATSFYTPSWVRTGFVPPSVNTQQRTAAGKGPRPIVSPPDTQKWPFERWLQDIVGNAGIAQHDGDKFQEWNRLVPKVPAEKPSGARLPSPGPLQVKKPIPPVPERPAGMAAEEFLRKCGLVTYGGKWILPEDKEMMLSVRAFYDLAKEVRQQIQLADADKAKWERAAKLRRSAVQEVDALRDKLRSGSPVFASEMQQAQRAVEQAEKTAKEAEATADASRTKATLAAEQLRPKVVKLRQAFDYGGPYYTRLAQSEAVSIAIAEYDDGGPGRRFRLGPSDTFAAAGKRIEEIQTMIDAAGPRQVAVDFRDERGASYVKVEISGTKTVEMIVDSGAQSVSLPWAIAVAAGLNPAAGQQVIVGVADGRRFLARKVTIPTLRVGSVQARNVDCVVNPPEYANAPLLLGKSFLKHFQWELDEVRRKLVFSQALDDDAEMPRSRP